MVKLAKKKTKTAPRRRSQPKNTQKTPVPQYLIAHTDPFRESALGVKVPDQNTAASGTAVSYGRATATTDATYGGWVGAFRYHPKGTSVSATGVATANTWTWQASFAGLNAATNLSSLSSQYGAIRCVGWGIHISCRQSDANAEGTVHIAHVPDVLNGSTWELPTSVAQMQSCGGYKNIRVSQLAKTSTTEVGRFTDQTAFRYIDPGLSDYAAPNIFPTSGWCTIVVFIEGAKTNSAVLEIDTVHHWEGLQSQGQGINPITAAAPFSPSVIAAVTHVSETISAARKIVDPDGDSSFWKDVKHYFATGLAIANGVRQGIELLAPVFV